MGVGVGVGGRLNSSFRQYFSLYQAVSPEGEGKCPNNSGLLQAQ